MEILEIGKHLIIHPGICHGKLTFKGTRVPVQTALTLLGKERKSIKYILKSWPYLKKEAIEEAVYLAAAAWPELLDDDVAERIQAMAATMKRGKKKPKVYEPVHSGRAG